MQRTGELIKLYANKYSLDPELVAAVVLQESGGFAKAKRLENGFYRRYVKKMESIGFMPRCHEDIPESVEAVLRSTSWGLMQIMLQTAREHGFLNKWASDLEERSTNLDLGCMILAKFIKATGSIRAGLLRWNGGGNPDYDDEVLERISDGSAKSFLEA